MSFPQKQQCPHCGAGMRVAGLYHASGIEGSRPPQKIKCIKCGQTFNARKTVLNPASNVWETDSEDTSGL